MPSRSDLERFDDTAALIVDAARAASSVPRIIIDGRSGAGKTTLAAAVAARFDGLHVLALDSVYPGWDGLRDGADAVVSGVLEAHAAGLPGHWQRWDWSADRPAEWHEVDPAAPLLVEGAGILTAAAARFADVSVWVEADSGIRRERALARDGETYVPHWQRWAAQEDAHLAVNAPQSLATITVAVR